MPRTSLTGLLTASQIDRVEGALLAQAVGDAMGGPYEPGDVPFTGAPEMLGGGLARNGVVGLTRLGDRRATAAAARAVAALTHADPLAGDSCVIQAEVIRSNIMNPSWQGAPFNGAVPLRTLDLIPQERRRYWHDLFDGGTYDPANCAWPGLPEGDGFTVDALGKAVLAFTYASRSAHAEGFVAMEREHTAARWMSSVLMRALASSRDRDTVAAIAGAMAGSYLGAGALDPMWAKAVHGIPETVHAEGLTRPQHADDLRELARATAVAGLAA